MAIGLDYSSLGPLTREVARTYADDLRLTVAPDLWPEERLFFRSDHFNFAAKEIPAMETAIKAGLRTWRDTIRREGYEPDEVLAEIKDERAAFAEAGVRVTSIEEPKQAEPAAPMPADDDMDDQAAA